jgi:hypothetical protein
LREPTIAAQIHFSFYLNHANPFAQEFIDKLPFSTSVTIGLQPDECNRALSSADVLLDLALSADVDAPLLMTKTATYLGLNRPVWAVCKPGGTSWNLVQRGWGYASNVNSGEGIHKTLRSIAADWRAGVLSQRRPTVELTKRFAPERYVSDLLGLCRYVYPRDPGSRPAPPDCLSTDWP